MYETTLTNVENLADDLNDLTNKGYKVYQILPINFYGEPMLLIIYIKSQDEMTMKELLNE